MDISLSNQPRFYLYHKIFGGENPLTFFTNVTSQPTFNQCEFFDVRYSMPLCKFIKISPWKPTTEKINNRKEGHMAKEYEK